MRNVSADGHVAVVMVKLRLIEGRWMAEQEAGRGNLAGFRHCRTLCDDGHPPLPTMAELRDLLCVGDGAVQEQVPVVPSSPHNGATRES